MAATSLIGMIGMMIETEGDLIVMMTAAGGMAHGMMTVVVAMVPGVTTAEDTSTGTMTVTALATNATTIMMMTGMKVETGLLTIETEAMWIIGTGIGMKGHGVLLVRQKDEANMVGIDQ
jgi:hypothetical protein